MPIFLRNFNGIQNVFLTAYFVKKTIITHFYLAYIMKKILCICVKIPSVNLTLHINFYLNILC